VLVIAAFGAGYAGVVIPACVSLLLQHIVNVALMTTAWIQTIDPAYPD